MNIRYYLDKPFFRDNLHRESSMHAMVQPEQLLRSYFREGRRIDYFYTNSDEQSNHSLIELIGDVPGLTKYRVDGRHGDVARASLPTTMGLIRRFVRGGDEQSLTVDEVNTFPDGNTLGMQVRIDDVHAPSAPANWYLDGSIGATRFRQILTGHDLPFVKYTNDQQRLSPGVDDLEGISGVVACDDQGTIRSGDLPAGAGLHLDHPPRHELSTRPLVLDTESPVPYTILRDDQVSQFSYQCRTGTESHDCIDIHIVSDIDAFDIDEARHRTNSRFVAAVEALHGDELLDLMIQRLHNLAACTDVMVHHDEVEDGAGARIGATADAFAGHLDVAN